MSAESLNCPNCGAPLMNIGDKSNVVCDHCGSLISIQPHQPPPAAQPPSSPPAPGSSYEPSYEYGRVPPDRPARSALASVTLGPADASQVIQLLRTHQELEAIQFYQSKVGGSLGEAKDAIGAIQAGLADASAPSMGRHMTMGTAIPTANPADLPEVRQLVDQGNTIGAIKAYRNATGQGLREAKVAVDGLERQLYPGRAPRPARRGCWPAGCLGVCLSLVILFMCIFGGCGTFLQTQAIYGCSMKAIKAELGRQEFFSPPINGGYVVIAPNYSSESNGSVWSLYADYYAPVWGANGVGVVSAHVTADSEGDNTLSATLYKDGQRHALLPEHSLECPKP